MFLRWRRGLLLSRRRLLSRILLLLRRLLAGRDLGLPPLHTDIEQTAVLAAETQRQRRACEPDTSRVSA